MECEKCGKCCEAIYLSENIEEVRRISLSETFSGNDKSTAKFILENWIPLTFEEARKINPYLVKEGDFSKNWYKCNQFNKESRLCNVHHERPNVCSGYPFYSSGRFQVENVKGERRLHADFRFYSEKCGFKKLQISEKELKELEELKIINFDKINHMAKNE